MFKWTLLHLTKDEGYPLFQQEVRGIGWLQLPGSFQRQRARIFVFVFALVTFVWWFFTYDTYRFSGRVYAHVTSDSLIAGLLIFTSVGNLLLDIVAMLGAVNSINREVISGRLDLLRLTQIGEAAIINAKHMAGQVRVWRVTLAIVSARITVLFLMIVHIAVLPYWFGRNYTILNSVFDSLRVNPVPTLFFLASFFLVWGIFIAEPLLRMPAMTALGIALSSRVRSSALGLLAGVLAIMAVWLVQGLIVGGMAGLLLLYMAGVRDFILAFGSLFIACGLLAWVVYYFYNRLQIWSLRYALRHTFRE